MDVRFDINISNLESKFKGLQRLSHPDKFATSSLEQQDASSQTSTAINEGYQIMKSKVERSNYLLELVFGVNANDESKSNDSLFMMEIFDLREQIEEEKDNKEALRSILEQLNLSTRQVCVDLDRHLEEQDCKKFNNDVIRLKYFSKVVEELEDALDES